MTNYLVTLTKAVRVYGKRRTIGAEVEVNEDLLEELQKHDAVKDAVEVEDDGNGQGETQVQTNVTLLEELPEYKNITGEEIKIQLTARNVEFEAKNKEDLYELLKTAMGITDESGE